jgi:methanogenic corrinoid protein MtbC1
MRKTSARPHESAGMLTIGALSRATGIAAETLRTWEARYGFPRADRKPSGHRVYDTAMVPRLRRVVEALARGHRAGEVVPASEASLESLLVTAAPQPARTADPIPDTVDTAALLALVEAFDADRLTAALLSEWARLTPVTFLETRLVPLVTAVGERWSAGALEIRHEHFVSERLGDVLRALRMSMDLRASGPLVACATLPGEAHALGLQMAALILAGAGLRVLFLGTEVPPRELLSVVHERRPCALAISVSAACAPRTATSMLTVLRRGLPDGVTLLLGGRGAPRLRGAVHLSGFGDLEAWARHCAPGDRDLGRRR